MDPAAIAAAAAAAAAAANVNAPVQPIVAANVHGPANIPAPPGALANVQRFALNPADLNQNFFDYTTTEGRKHFERATELLDIPYDGSSKGLNMFIHQIKSKASVCGWTNSIMTMPTVANPHINLSLLVHYGQLTLDDVHAHALTYINQPVRASQDANNLKVFLDCSLGKDLMMRVVAQQARYTIQGVEHSPSMFRVIIGIVGIETRATIAVINASLCTLPAKMAELKGNVVTFNEYVMEQCSKLTSRGRQPYNLLFLLFEAYRTIDDKAFVEYIITKESAVLDKTIADLEPRELMILAEEKYKIMVLRGEWATTSGRGVTTTDEHIVALKAELEVLKASMKKAPSNSQTTAGTASGNTGKWKWKDSAPKGQEPKFKTFEGREYVHCPNHKSTKWVLAEKHKDGCTLDASWKFPGHTHAAQSAPQASSESAAHPYIKALMSVMTEEDKNEWQDENV
jgi:hypothetical protein